MSTYTQVIYHVIFSTKTRERSLDKSRRDDLYRFIWGVLQKRKCHLYRIGGVEDHVHILTSLHPAVALSDLVKEIKTASSLWIKGQQLFPWFTHWQDGYGAFTHALPDKDRLIDYIRTQEEHHKHITFREEYERLLTEAGLAINKHDNEWFDDDGDPGDE
jgi:putative transposase